MVSAKSKSSLELKEITLRKTFKHELSQELEKLVLEEFNKSISGELEEYFGLSLNYSKPVQALVYETGHYFAMHKDDVANEDGKIHRKITTVLFLNEQSADQDGLNYEGGLLKLYGLLPHLPQKGFSVPCRKGSLVAFRSDTVHEVTEVISGQRFTLVVWFE